MRQWLRKAIPGKAEVYLPRIYLLYYTKVLLAVAHKCRPQTSGASPYALAPRAWDVSLAARSEERELFSRATLGPLANNACNANKICGKQYERGAPGRELVHRGSLAGRIRKCTKHRKD